MLKRQIFIWILLLLVAGSGFAQKKKSKTQDKKAVETTAPAPEVKPQLPAPVKVTSVEGITEYRLHNGLRVLLFPDQSKQTITVNITYLVGSKHENYGETGMAHLLEHLVFKGTPRHPNIPQELTEHGARPNGTTWVDRTNYFETFSATEENLKWALDLEADRMVNSFIAKKDLDSEMTVVRNEFESGENSPFRVLMQRTMSAAFDWHNYGKSTIGARSDIENVSIERLQAFYKKYYQPDNAVLVVAGKFDEPKTLELVNQYFGAIPKPTRELQQFYTLDPTQDGERTVTVRRVGDLQLVMAAYRIPPGSHADYAPVAVLSQVLGTEPSGRLYKALVDTKLASSTFTFDFQWKEPGLMLNIAEVLKEKSLDDAKKAMLKTLDDISKNPPTKEEIERAKTEILKQTDLMFNSSERVGLALSEAIGTGDWRLLHLTRDRIKAVTAEDVARVAKQYIKQDNRTVGIFIPTENPDRAEIPAAPDVELLVKDYKGQQSVAQGEAFDPSPANIEERTTRTELPGGIKLALLPKKTRGEAVEAVITFRFGNEKALAGKGNAASYAGRLLNKGTAKRSRQDIKDEFDRLKANVSIGGGAQQAYVSISTTKPNLAEVLKLVAEILKEPAFPADEFEKAKSEDIAGIESQRSEPQSIAFTKIQKHISPYPKSDPRYVEDFDESIAAIKALKLDDVKKFYKEFYGASNTTLSVVGDFDAAEIQSLVSELFGNWKSPSTYTRLPGKRFDVPVINESIETPDKANAMFVAMYTTDMRDDNPDYPALVLGNYMLGGGFLNSRLATRIRQKEGLSYGVGSNFSAGSIDPIGTFMAYAIYAPENVEKLEAAFKEEIEKASTEGFTEEEIAAAKSGWLQSRTVSRAQDRSLANTLSNYLFLGRDLTWDENLEKKISELTPEQINSAMKKHLKAESFNIVKAGDFAKAKAKAEEK
ncbi:MAG: insulinase family protein [Cyclobacteriaceae bacterium]|nr:insulinase family protein [Cyclobacteriaceae bacterium]